MYLLEIEKTDDLDKYKKQAKRYPLNPVAKPLHATKFIVDEISMESMQITLHKLKNSFWWNNDGFFLVKNIKTSNSCGLSYSLSKIFWEFNILNAVFLCHDPDLGISLYTYNPYYTSAPKPWEKVGSYTQDSGYPLTLFRNSYHILGKSMFIFYTNGIIKIKYSHWLTRRGLHLSVVDLDEALGTVFWYVPYRYTRYSQKH